MCHLQFFFFSLATPAPNKKNKWMAKCDIQHSTDAQNNKDEDTTLNVSIFIARLFFVVNLHSMEQSCHRARISKQISGHYN